MVQKVVHWRGAVCTCEVVRVPLCYGAGPVWSGLAVVEFFFFFFFLFFLES